MHKVPIYHRDLSNRTSLCNRFSSLREKAVCLAVGRWICYLKVSSKTPLPCHFPDSTSPRFLNSQLVTLRAVSLLLENPYGKMSVTTSVTYQRWVEKPDARGFEYHACALMLFCVLSFVQFSLLIFKQKKYCSQSTKPLAEIFNNFPFNL